MTEQLNEQQIQEWARDQFQSANQYLAQQGILFDSVIVEECRYLAPFVAVWKIKSLDHSEYWVITGDLPSDLTLATNASSAKEALRYFSMQWQLKAQNLEQSNHSDDAEQQHYIEILRDRAENLYNLQDNQGLWA